MCAHAYMACSRIGILLHKFIEWYILLVVCCSMLSAVTSDFLAQLKYTKQKSRCNSITSNALQMSPEMICFANSICSRVRFVTRSSCCRRVHDAKDCSQTRVQNARKSQEQQSMLWSGSRWHMRCCGMCDGICIHTIHSTRSTDGCPWDGIAMGMVQP